VQARESTELDAEMAAVSLMVEPFTGLKLKTAAGW